ncbi:MAG: dihydrodipicolinate synthase family protein [Promethearchaeota archaeon]
MVNFNRALIPAVPTWFKHDGNAFEIAKDLNKRYIKKLLEEPIAGVASLVHTGRGSYLTIDEKEAYLGEIVDVCHDKDKVIITGVNSVEDARLARRMKVDMVLIFPNRSELTSLDDPDRLRKIVEYHEKIIREHGRGCIFLLYEDTGIGIQYTLEEISHLISIDGISSIKFALLSNFELYEDYVTELASTRSGVDIFTGEDRMLAESMEKIRDITLIDPSASDIRINALVGLGCVLPYLQSFILKSFDKAEYQDLYFRARSIVSAIGRACFQRPIINGKKNYSLPMEEYIINVGMGSAFQFNIPKNAIPDIAFIESERKNRGIPRKISEILSRYNPQLYQDKIIKLVMKGMELERSLKIKFGKQLEKL